MTVPQIDGYGLFNDTANQIVSGGFSLRPTDILSDVFAVFTAQVRDFSKTAAVIVIMALLSSTVGTLNSSFGKNSAGQAAFFVFFTVISGLLLSCFSTAMGYAAEVIGQMTSFMDKLTPVLIMSLFTCCKSVSAAAFEPVLSAVVYAVSLVIEKCLVPLMTFSAVLSVVGSFGDTNSISGFIKIIRSVTKWLMAFIITLFTGINAVYGFSVSSLDAISAKAIKFAMGSLVPIVGGFLSDSLDTVTTSAALIKNAVGVSGIVIICLIVMTPVIKIGAMQLMMKLCAAVVEPMTDKRISDMLWNMSETITAVFGTVVLTAVLFVLNICIILRATG